MQPFLLHFRVILFIELTLKCSKNGCTSVSVLNIPPFAVLQCQTFLTFLRLLYFSVNIPCIPPFAVLQCQTFLAFHRLLYFSVNIPCIPPFAVLQCQTFLAFHRLLYFSVKHSLHSTVCCTSVSNIPCIPPFAVLQCQHSSVCVTWGEFRYVMENSLGSPPVGKRLGGSLTSRSGLLPVFQRSRGVT